MSDAKKAAKLYNSDGATEEVNDLCNEMTEEEHDEFLQLTGQKNPSEEEGVSTTTLLAIGAVAVALFLILKPKSASAGSDARFMPIA